MGLDLKSGRLFQILGRAKRQRVFLHVERFTEGRKLFCQELNIPFLFPHFFLAFSLEKL